MLNKAFCFIIILVGVGGERLTCKTVLPQKCITLKVYTKQFMQDYDLAQIFFEILLVKFVLIS